MGLVDNAEDLVATLHGQRDETAILDDEDLVLGVADHSGLILRHLNDSKTVELNHGLGNCNTWQQSATTLCYRYMKASYFLWYPRTIEPTNSSEEGEGNNLAW